jgi:methyl-accepting chemotaxis protein
MDMDYVVVTVVALFCALVVTAIMVRMNGTGIGLRLAIIVLIPIVMVAITCFFLGKSGLTILNLSIVAIVDSTVVLILLTMLTRQLVQPILALTCTAEEIAGSDLKNLKTMVAAITSGDLTVQTATISKPIELKSYSELQLMINAFNGTINSLQEINQLLGQMLLQLNSVIGQIATNANNLNFASDQLAGNARQASQATVQISSTIQQVAQGIGQQADSVSQTTRSVEQMNQTIEGVSRGAQEQSKAVTLVSQITGRINTDIQHVASNAQAVTERSAEAATAARKGAVTVEDTLKGMSNIREKVGVSATKVRELGARSDQIGAIVEVIDDIASQTNLLALNAAIEAARAGEQGKGFAVVADEVRKLAERSSSATKEIGGLVKSIQTTVGEAVKAMDEGAQEINVGVNQATAAGQALHSILIAAEAVLTQAQEAGSTTKKVQIAAADLVGAIETVSSVVTENKTSTGAMASHSSQVVQAFENIASVSEENSAAVEEVSASAEEMSAQVEEVTNSVQNLVEMASDLNQIVDRFKLTAMTSPKSAANPKKTAVLKQPAPTPRGRALSPKI